MTKTTKRKLEIGLLLLAPLVAVACSTASSAPNDVGVAAPSAAIHGDADEIPCGPRAVLESVCQQCHARVPRNGAPFSLVGRSDVMAMYGGVVVRELMIEEIDAGRMPLPPVTIEPAQRDVLLAWLRAGAPAAVPTSCAEAGADAALGDASADTADALAETSAGEADTGAQTIDASDPDAADASTDADPDAAPL